MSSQDTEARDFLRLVPIFAGLSPQLQDRVADCAELIHVTAGELVFGAGDPGDALYVLESGRLEVVAGDGELIRVLGRGAVIGELALLTGEARSASVRARRDSSLLRLDRGDFDALMRDEPGFAVGLTRQLGGQLRASRARALGAAPRPSVLAVVPLDAQVDINGFVDGLVTSLNGLATVAWVDDAALGEGEGTTADFGHLVDEADRTHDLVLVVSPQPDLDHPWTAFCLREADRVLAVAGAATGLPSGDERLTGCDLALVDTRAPRAASGWQDALAPRAIHHAGGTAGVERLARRLAGRSVGVVLSGGGARGFAHIGVLEALSEAGVVIDRVGGCSMGAFVAAMFAAGIAPAEIHARCREEFAERNPLNDYTVPMASLIRGRKVEDMLRRTFGERRIEDLDVEYFCVSCDLISSELVVHRHGDLFEAVGSSMCLPGVGAPVPVDGRLLVDGGVLNNLPVEEMAGRGEGPVIAVDVTARFEPPQAAESRFRCPGLRRAAAHVRAWASGRETPVPSLKETLIRTITLGSIDTAEAAQRHADLIVTPEVSAFGMLEFERIDDLCEAGREAARAVVAEATAL